MHVGDALMSALRCPGLAYAARAPDEESCVYAMHSAMGVTFRHQLSSSLHATADAIAPSALGVEQKENDDASNDTLLSSAMERVALGGAHGSSAARQLA